MNVKNKEASRVRVLLTACGIWLELIVKDYPQDLIMGIGEVIISIKNNDYSTRDERGRFTGSVPRGGSGGGTSARRSKPPKMSHKERSRVSHGIATDFPKLKADGLRRTYEYGNYQYEFYVIEFGRYSFVSKFKLE